MAVTHQELTAANGKEAHEEKVKRTTAIEHGQGYFSSGDEFLRRCGLLWNVLRWYLNLRGRL